MSHKKSRNNHHPDPIAQEVKALLSDVNLVSESNKSEAEPAKPADPKNIDSMLEDADIDFSSLDSPEPVEQKPETVSNPKPSTEDEMDKLLDGVDLTQPESAKPEAKIDFEIPEEDDDETTSDSSEKTEEKTDPGTPPDEPDLPSTEPISWSFDPTEDGDTEGEGEGPVSLDDDEYEPKEEDTQPQNFAEELKSPTDEPVESTETGQSTDTSANTEKRRQVLINRLTKKFGPDVEQEIKDASEVLTEESMQNLLLQYWAEDQEFKAEDEIHQAQERLNKKSWKQKIAESRTIGRFFPVGSAILGTGLGIVGSVVARSGANILIKKALMNTVHHGLGELTAMAVGGTFGAIKGYLHEKERRRDAKQLLADIERAVDSSNINGIGGLQLINEAIKDGLKGDEETMQKIIDWQSRFRFMAINEHQLGVLAEQGLEQIERGKLANEVILDNLSELFDRKANLEFKESKKKFKKTYDRGWEQMGKKIGKGALAGGITSLLAYEFAHWIVDHIGATPPSVAPESVSQPETPTSELTHPSITETPATETPSTSPSTEPSTEPSLPQSPIEATPEAPLIPESPHDITNPTDYARELTIQDPTFQDMVDKFAAGQVSGEDGADSILNHHGVKADYEIPKLNGATLSDQLQEFVQANHDKLKDPETAQAVYSAVYHLASHPTLFIDYQTGQLSAEQLASDWHSLSQSLPDARGVEVIKNIDKFIDSQHQLWNGDHLPKDIAEEFIKTQPPVVDAANVGITVPDAAAAVAPASTLSQPSLPSSPSAPVTPPSSPVSFWQSPVGNGLKALGCIGVATGLVGLRYLDKKDGNKEQVGQSEQPEEPDQVEQKVEEKNKTEEAKQESSPVQAEIVYNKPDTIEEFIKFVQKDLELKLHDLPVNSVIMELTIGASGRSAEIDLSPQAIKIDLGYLGYQSFRTGNLGNIDLGQLQKIWFSNGESTPVYEVSDHVGVRDVDNPSRKPDFSKPGYFEFYYIK